MYYRHLRLKVHDFYAKRNVFHRTACSNSLNWVLFCLCFCSLCFLFCLFVRWLVSSQTSEWSQCRFISFLFCHGFGTDETATFHSLRYISCEEKRGRGSWYTYSNCAVWSNLNGLYFDNKSSPAIYWSKLSTVPEENIPKSAEKKIRPVDFFSSFLPSFGILTENPSFCFWVVL